jgi:ribosomal protein S18 acetylase RimI-like enzyme
MMPPKSPPALRDYRPSDRARLLAHFDVTWRATYEPAFAAWSLNHVSAPPDPVTRLSGENGRMLVAEAAGEIVGSAGRLFVEQVSYVTAMYIRPDWQRQGVGAALLSATLRRLPQDRNVVVYAMTSSAWALAFYESAGFERFEERDLDVGFVTPFPSVGLFLHKSLLARFQD